MIISITLLLAMTVACVLGSAWLAATVLPDWPQFWPIPSALFILAVLAGWAATQAVEIVVANPLMLLG